MPYPFTVLTMLVFRHVATAGPFAAGENPEAINRNNQGADKYSRLDHLEKFRSKLDGKLHFKLCYPGIIIHGTVCMRIFNCPKS